MRRPLRNHAAIFLSLLFLGLFHPMADGKEMPDWRERARILKRIAPPVFPARDFLVTSYGAIDDGTTDCTEAFRKAIDACAAAGGGRVLVPEGTFLTGAIHLRSNVNLHLAKGAVVKFSTDPAHYLPVVFTRWEGTECMNYSALIYAYEQKNIAVTGEGVLDGQGANENWWKWTGKKEFGWKPGDVSAKEDRKKLVDFGAKGTPVRERVFGAGHYLRPNFFQPYKCTNVLIEGVTLKDSPMWFLHPTLSKNVIVRNVTINGLGPNNDGCDPESCEDVLIENTSFNTGDDCIAIKSGRNNDGRRVNRPTKNVVITGCRMLDGHGGVVIGSEVSGGVSNVFADNCEMDSPRLDRALRFKTNSVRGGLLENFYARSIRVGQVAEAALIVDFQYEEGDAGAFTPTLRNIHIDSLTCRKGEYAVLIRAYERAPVTDLTITNSTFTNIEKPIVLEYVKNVRFENVSLNGKDISQRIDRAPVAADPPAPKAPARAAANGARWSVKLAENFMKLHPDSITYAGEAKSAKWNYEQGLMMEAFCRLWKATGDERYLAYVKQNADHYVQSDGSIATYKKADYNLDNIAAGRPLFTLMKATGDAKYRAAIDTLRAQLASQPRTTEGGFWHKLIYPSQMWLDGLYMAEPFYAQYAVDFNEPKDLDDVARQFLLASKHMKDAKTGLYYHGWDESKKQKWADPATGCSPNFWGRSIGWYMMGLVDVLDFLPERHPRRAELLAVFRGLAQAMEKYRDAKTGLWYQVVDQPERAGNYREASVSAMLTYAYARGALRGLLDMRYYTLAQETFHGITTTLVTKDPAGTLSLNHVCSVAGLGGSPYRDGSFEYYVHEPQRANDFKGYGPLMLAAIVLEWGPGAARDGGVEQKETSAPATQAQGKIVVGLDNFFNNETKKVGQETVGFHYLWSDTANSGFSELGKLFERHGAVCDTLRQAPTAQNLARFGVYIIVDPDTPLETPAPKYMDDASASALYEWVKAGGVLVLLENDKGNAEFEHFNTLARKFGMHFNEDSYHRVEGTNFEQGKSDVFPAHPLFKGVKKIYMKEVSSITVSKPAKALLEENGVVLMATAAVGKGMVLAVGDPWLYNEYIDNRKLPVSFENYRAAQNLVAWLLAHAAETKK